MLEAAFQRKSRSTPARKQVRTYVLLAATGLGIYLCYRLCEPFLSPLAWALALAVVAHPVHRWLADKIRWANVAAGTSVALVTLLLLPPTVMISRQLAIEATRAAEFLQSDELYEQLQTAVERYPRLTEVFDWFQSEVDVSKEGSAVAQKITPAVPGVLSGSMWIAAGTLITLMTLFFFLRDSRLALDSLRSFLPLSNAEANQLFKRVHDAIFATVYGTLLVATAQGFMGGLMFWWLGLPSPLFWGVVMALLAIVPVLGAFVVWVPAAIGLAIQGEWTKALLLTLWGSVVIGLIDNLLYPFLVGHRLRLHTLPVFFAIVGGLTIFGAAGLVLGPVVLAVTLGLIDVWRSREARVG